MAITDGLAIACGDLQATGGIKRVLIREWNSTGSPDDIILGATGVHTVTSIMDSSGNLDPATALDTGTRQQTFAKLGSIEGGSGAAFSDENGLTVTLTCTQFELPRLYVNATPFAYSADGLTVEVV